MIKTVKKIIAALLGAVMLAALSGCMRIGIDVELKKNGTATGKILYAMAAEYCKEEDFADSGYEVKHFNFDGKEYIGYEVSEDKASYADLCNDLMTYSEDGTSLFTSVSAEKVNSLFTTKYVFDAVMPALAADGGEMAAGMIRVDFGLKMPGKVKSCSGGTVNDDGSVTFNIKTTEECEFRAESEELNLITLGIAALAVFLAIGGVVTAVNKKK